VGSKLWQADVTVCEFGVARGVGSLYFDDVEFFTTCDWARELSAIREFNDEHDCRKIGLDRSIPGPERIPFLKWYPPMFVGQILDHPERQVPG
jgi:hypothetical protein